MIKEVIVEAETIRLNPNSIKGEGGEATIFGLPGNEA